MSKSITPFGGGGEGGVHVRKGLYMSGEDDPALREGIVYRNLFTLTEHRTPRQLLLHLLLLLLREGKILKRWRVNRKKNRMVWARKTEERRPFWTGLMEMTATWTRVVVVSEKTIQIVHILCEYRI